MITEMNSNSNDTPVIAGQVTLSLLAKAFNGIAEIYIYNRLETINKQYTCINRAMESVNHVYTKTQTNTQ